MSPNQPPDDRLRSILTQRVPVIVPPDPIRRQAAVLLPLFRNATDYHLLFTKRTETVRQHKGQVSFPGGSFEPADGDLQTTALRESYEEVGIQPEHVTILGRLDDLATFSTSFTISPFVGLIPYPYPFRPNPLEVAIVFDVRSPPWLIRLCSAGMSAPGTTVPRSKIMSFTSMATSSGALLLASFTTFCR